MVRLVGQAMASLGAKDPRKDTTGALDFCLQRMYHVYTRNNPPPHRVKPILISLIRHLAERNLAPYATPEYNAITDMVIIAFFFLLLPGEYTGSSRDDTLFQFANIQLFCGEHTLDHLTNSDHTLLTATSASLTFTMQKNGIQGKIVNHGLSGHPLMCPVQALAWRINNLRSHASPTTIIAAYLHDNKLHTVTGALITATLKCTAAICGPEYGFHPSDITAHSLRAGGAMALFNSDVDRGTI